SVLLFFFQAEDGIRDFHVTGVQTCALPIYPASRCRSSVFSCRNSSLFWRSCAVVSSADLISGSCSTVLPITIPTVSARKIATMEIGRASCRERVEVSGVGGGWKGIEEKERA